MQRRAADAQIALAQAQHVAQDASTYAAQKPQMPPSAGLCFLQQVGMSSEALASSLPSVHHTQPAPPAGPRFPHGHPEPQGPCCQRPGCAAPPPNAWSFSMKDSYRPQYRGVFEDMSASISSKNIADVRRQMQPDVFPKVAEFLGPPQQHQCHDGKQPWKISRKNTDALQIFKQSKRLQALEGAH